MNTFNWYRKIFLLICLTLIFVLTIGNAEASPMLRADNDFTAIDTYVTEQMKTLQIPGLALGIVQGDQVVHLQGFGIADSNGRSVTPQTPFYIGSITKPFTALAVMQLVEEGKLDLDAPVQKYLPWFQMAGNDSSRITVRNLITHSSGFSEKDGNRLWISLLGLEDTLRGLGQIPLTRPVGTAFQYSNINFSLAGLIIEKVSGEAYSNYVVQHIFKPLEMNHSYTFNESAMADGLSEGHYYMFGHPFAGKGPLPPSYLPSGFLISTAEDLSHFAIAQLNDGQYNSASILSPQGITETHKAVVPMRRGDYSYAMGWAVGTTDGIHVLRHDGDTGYFHGIILLQPDKKYGVIVLSNVSGFAEITQPDDIAKNVLAMLNDREPTSVSSSFAMRFLYWTLLLMPFILIVGIVRGWRDHHTVIGWRVWMTVLLYFAIGIGVLQIPIPFPIPSMLVFYPDVAHGLIAIAALGIGWSVVYTALNLTIWKSN